MTKLKTAFIAAATAMMVALQGVAPSVAVAPQGVSASQLGTKISYDSVYLDLSNTTFYPSKKGFRDTLMLKFGIYDATDYDSPVDLTYGELNIYKGSKLVKSWAISSEMTGFENIVRWDGRVRGKLSYGKHRVELVLATKSVPELVLTDSVISSKKKPKFFTATYKYYGRDAFDKYYKNTYNGCKVYGSRIQFRATYDMATCVGIQIFSGALKKYVRKGSVDAKVILTVSKKNGCVSLMAPQMFNRKKEDCTAGTNMYPITLNVGEVAKNAQQMHYSVIGNDSSMIIHEVRIVYTIKK